MCQALGELPESGKSKVYALMALPHGGWELRRRQKINKIISDSGNIRARPRPYNLLERVGAIAWVIWEVLSKEVMLELSPE